MHTESIQDKENFWMKYALEKVDWIDSPTTALDSSNPPFFKWFPDGTLNMCYNAVDRHINRGNGEQTAIASESRKMGK